MKELILKLSTPKKLAIVAAILGMFALIIGDPTNSNKISVNAKALALSTIKDQDKIDVMTLADWLIKGNADYALIDLRNEKKYSEYNIPSSINIRMEDLLSSDLMRNQKILLYGDDDVAAAQAWFILKSSGFKGVYILEGGMTAWKDEIMFPKLSANATPEQTASFEKAKQVSLFFGGTPQIVSGSESSSAVSMQKAPAQSVPKLTVPANTKSSAKKKKEGC